MDRFASTDRLHTLLTELLDWLQANVLSADTLMQVALMAVALLLAWLVAARAVERLARLEWPRRLGLNGDLPHRVGRALGLPLLWIALAGFALAVAQRLGLPTGLLAAMISLLAAWITIRFTSLLVRDAVLSKAIALGAWIVATLSILDLLAPTIDLLDGIAVQLGQLRLSALLVIKGVLSLAVFLWLAVAASKLMERRIRALPTFTPSIQVLISKLLRIVLITVAVVASLGIVGIDLTAFAVFTGAVGVGVGFGLQKVVSNLVSGVILLLDRSVKPGDVISVGDTFGWINSLGARYVSVITRDGREYLIPNEDLITQQVVNWSYSNNEIRLALPIGISYDADVRLAIDQCLKAAAATPRVLQNPVPTCLLRGFGDSSVNLELRVWISDPQNGIGNVQSELLLAVWERFHAHGIAIPYPQRDLHLVPPARVRVVMEPEESTESDPPAAPGSGQDDDTP